MAACVLMGARPHVMDGMMGSLQSSMDSEKTARQIAEQIRRGER